jgi:hypothetical protein
MVGTEQNPDSIVHRSGEAMVKLEVDALEILARGTPASVDAQQRARGAGNKCCHEAHVFAKNPSDVAAKIESGEYAEFHGTYRKQHLGRHFGELVIIIRLQTGVCEGLALVPSPRFGATRA